MDIWSILAHWALSSTLQTGVLVTLISLITWIAWRHLSAQWTSTLWILVLLRLAVPWSPRDGLLMLAGRANTVLPEWVSDLSKTSAPATALARVANNATRSPQPHAVTVIHWPIVAVCVWGLGALIVALRSVRMERRFRHAVSQSRMPTPLGMNLYETAAVRAPAAFGLWHPQILIPPGLRERLTPAQWQWVVQHERHHILRLDIMVRWAMEIAAILYWFNPFVWIARRASRAAQELAADEGVIRWLSPQDRVEYGRVLLAVAAYAGSGVPSVANMKLEPSSLARRIARIHETPHGAMARGTTVVAVMLTVVVLSAAAMATGATPSSYPLRFPPGLGNSPGSQSATARASSNAAQITADTFDQAVRTALARQIHASDRQANVARELSHAMITAVRTIKHVYTAQVIIPFQGHLFMGTLGATRQGVRWTFAFPGGVALGWIDPQHPLNVMETGGEFTPTSKPYFFVAGVARPGIKYVVIHFSSGAVVQVHVSLAHTFAYLTDSQTGTQVIDAYSATHHLVYRW